MKVRPDDLCVLVLSRSPLRAKSRLGGVLGPRERAVLAEAMLRDVLAAARASALGPLYVATESGRVGRVARGHGARVLRTAARGMGPAARAAAARLAGLGYRRVLAIPADLPLLRASDLVRSAAAGRRADVVIVPDGRRQGTNALLFPPGALRPRFGPDSARRHAEAARLAGLRMRLISNARIALDVDTPDDLRSLTGRSRDAGTFTRRALVALGLASPRRASARRRAEVASQARGRVSAGGTAAP